MADVSVFCMTAGPMPISPVQGQPYGGPGEDLRMPFAGGLPGLADDGQELGRIEESKKKLAKRANEIYRSLCSELALTECFFYGFGAWSEFVDGKISEPIFYERARAEALSYRGEE